MKIVSSLNIILLIVISFSACKSNSGKHTIAMRLAKGDTFNIATSMKMQYEMEIGTMKQAFSMVNEAEMAYEVLDSTSAGAEMVMTMRDQKSKIDFGKETPGSDAEKMADSAAKAMIGRKIHFKVKNGEVSDVRGWEEMMPKTDSVQAAFAKDFIPEESFRELSGMLFDMYPEKPVGIGDSWTKNSTVTVGGIPIKMITKYTLKDVKDGLAHISTEGKMEGKESEVPMMPGMKMKFSGPMNGISQVDLSSGYLKGFDNTFDIKAEAEFAGQKINMKMKGSSVATGR